MTAYNFVTRLFQVQILLQCPFMLVAKCLSGTTKDQNYLGEVVNFFLKSEPIFDVRFLEKYSNTNVLV